jgi:hypothetical protein
MIGQIYMSYRRSVDGSAAAVIGKEISERISGRPLEAEPADEDWLQKVNKDIRSSDVLLSVIGPDWLAVTDARGRRRIDDPADLVRHELRAAAHLRKLVIPVLVGGAALPSRDELPDDVAYLAGLKPIRVGLSSLKRDTRALLQAIASRRRERWLRRAADPLILVLLAGSVLFAPNHAPEIEINDLALQIKGLADQIGRLQPSTGFVLLSIGNSIAIVVLATLLLSRRRLENVRLSMARLASQGAPLPRCAVFISYRRADAATEADVLHRSIEEVLGQGMVFKDDHSIIPGTEFTEEIRLALAQCEFCLVVIGNQWLTHRLQDPGDWVRREIETALTRGIRVIPVLVGEAKLPDSDQLPQSISGLLARQAAPFRPGPTRDGDIERIVRFLA